MCKKISQPFRHFDRQGDIAGQWHKHALSAKFYDTKATLCVWGKLSVCFKSKNQQITQEKDKILLHSQDNLDIKT